MTSERTRRGAAVAVLALTLALAACDRGGEDARVRLDGSPRRADVAGVVSQVTRTRLTLDEGETYRIDRDVQSFSSQTLQAVPILQRRGQYVHVGVEGDRAVWVAAVGSVIRGRTDVVYYPGTVKAVTGREVLFADGTVLVLARGVEPPAANTKVVAEIDPRRDLVTAIPLA